MTAIIILALLPYQYTIIIINIPPGSSAYGIFQTRILKWVAMPSSRRSSQPRDQTQVSCVAGGFFIGWATREALILIRLSFVSKNRKAVVSPHSDVFSKAVNDSILLFTWWAVRSSLSLELKYSIPWRCHPVTGVVMRCLKIDVNS